MTLSSAARAAFDGSWLVPAIAGLALISVVTSGAGALLRLDKLSKPPRLSNARERVPPPGVGDPKIVVALAPFGAPIFSDTASGELTLKAIVQGSPQTATALIAVRDGPAQAYRTGDQIGGARLTTVAIDHVLLDAGGGLFRLDFPKALPRAGSDVAPTSPNAPAGVSAPVGTPAASASGPDENGQGYRVGVAPTFQRAGVRAGDVITSVNGLPVGDMERDIFDAVASGKARVEVQREGRSLVLPAKDDQR